MEFEDIYIPGYLPKKPPPVFKSAWRGAKNMDQEFITEEELLPIIRKQYIENPPDGYTSEDIREMSDEDLLDMDYFLNEDAEFITEEELLPTLRKQYIENPPDGYTSEDIREMSDEDLLDMDYFLNE